MSPCGALCRCTCGHVGATGSQGGMCLPPGSQGRGRCQAGAAGDPEDGSHHSTHTGGLGPPGPGTGNSQGCPWRSYRPPLRKTGKKHGSAPHYCSPLHTRLLTVVSHPEAGPGSEGQEPVRFLVLPLNAPGPALSTVQPEPQYHFILTMILSDESYLLAPFDR